jgi:hypothetical protein
MRDWHRIFAVSLADVVTGLPFHVVQELELARIKQRLDVALIRLIGARLREQAASWPDLPDGLEELADHNLVSYKSLHESLTCGAMCEVVSNAVLYAKQEWGDDWEATLLDSARLKLLAVTTHRPVWLKPDQEPGQTCRMPGVYDVQFLRLTIRVIVPREVGQTPKNALWHLLSGDPDRVRYGMEHYHLHDAALYNILNDLRETYALEGVEMPYTIEDYKREVARELLKKMSPRERREVLSPDELLEGLSPPERLQGLSPPERLQGLSPRERLQGLSPRELLEILPPEEIQAYLDELRSKAKVDADRGRKY